MTFNEIEQKIYIKAKKDNLLDLINIKANKLKLLSDIGLLSTGVLLNDKKAMQLNIGRVIIDIIILCKQSNMYTLEVVTNKKSLDIYTDLNRILSDFKNPNSKNYPLFEIIEIANYLDVDYLDCLNIAFKLL